ncbi:N-succinylarginine dihydrolase [Endozoicomonas sp. SCSIO W0465]|uniref:N-succinylarginine dihydrolase n=1 Tax=Endozoicomonas sp. SCSIO W0465 TaxID=2918516 RepID=UPI0020765282|nr:N-succinylarginine dihydrolase [Endozoicomonas sp. SCSIO W0465]USE37501.1 N-succinylarginine dihydrolase [Endozoicomonas sp. SCSIO W0465]
MTTIEANFDGLVGPTHNYAGLSKGNKASIHHAGNLANPRQAALQGLEKMKALSELGFVQGVLAPQERPDIATLRRLGFTGSDSRILSDAAQQMPAVLAACCSASSMWTANAATVSPSADCADGKVHFTPANLINKFHRSIEHDVTGNILKATFNSPDHFVHHQALPSTEYFGDEGAANHTRFCHEYGAQGVEFFVYGKEAFNQRSGFGRHSLSPQKYPARQSLEASQAVARLHQLDPDKVVFAQQNPAVIDQGVFHNDVIAVGNRNLLFCHEQSFVGQGAVYESLRRSCGPQGLHIVEVADQQVSVGQAVGTYLFNSQLLSLENGGTMIVVPSECEHEPAVWSYLQSILNDASCPITDLKVFDLRQSMNNGGGPACLRLRVVLNDQELAATNQQCLIDSQRFLTLSRWVKKHYRDQLSEKDLADPLLLTESRTALDELTRILNLGSIYPFQH